MPSSTMVSRLLEAADDLLSAKPGSAAYRRRAVSNVYYALFHQTAKICADVLVPSSGSRSETYARVYRALNHGPMKKSFEQSPLKDHPKIQKIGTVIIRLQAERHSADYLPPAPHLFPLDTVAALLEQARQTIADLNDLAASDRMLLATCLLFTTR